jgi:Holliday junction resolvase YEN1
LLRQLKVPYHQAPAEAEAECARLQALGVVDAVWSDDSDALMFGCDTLIQQHKIRKKMVQGHIKVYQAKTLLEKHDLDPDGFFLFAVLTGGVYNTKHLPGCGPKTAALLSKQDVGLAQKLRNALGATLPTWRGELQDDLRRYGKATEVPFGFPQFKPLNNHWNPTVSTPEQLHDLRGLKNG